jgi:hypothetical protein
MMHEECVADYKSFSGSRLSYMNLLWFDRSGVGAEIARDLRHDTLRVDHRLLEAAIAESVSTALYYFS